MNSPTTVHWSAVQEVCPNKGFRSSMLVSEISGLDPCLYRFVNLAVLCWAVMSGQVAEVTASQQFRSFC